MKKLEAVILVCILLCSTFPFTFSSSPVSATGAHDVEDEIIIGEIETDNLPTYFSDITGGISDVVFSNDSNYVATCSDDGYIYVYNTSNLSLAATLGYGDAFNTIDFSDDGTYLVGSLYTATGGASIFWTSNWTLKQNVTDPTSYCKDIDFSPNGTWLAVSSSDEILYIYDVADFSLNTSWDTGQVPLYDTVQFTEDSQYLVYGKYTSTNITVYYTSNWSIKTDIDIWSVIDPIPISLDFSPDGDWMAVGVAGTPTKVHIFNTTTWTVDTNITFSLGACTPGCPEIESISFSGDSQWMMVAGSDTENDLIYNYIVNTTTWESVREWSYSSVIMDSDVSFSNNSQYIADSICDDTKIRVRAIFTVERNASITPVVNSLNEQNNLTFAPTRSYTGNVTLKVPVSNDVGGIVAVRNNTDGVNASEVDDKGSLVNNTFWYDSANQFVYIRTINLTTSSTVDWTVNCSHGINFNLIIPSYLEVGQYFQSEGFISNSSGYAITGMIAETRLLYANGTDALSVNPKHNCTGGNYDCRFSTSTLLPGIYSVSIEFTDPTSGIMFKEGGTLYLSVDPGSGIHVSTFLHFTFYNNNTGIGIPSESFKVYASTDTTIDSDDRIYVDLYGVYTGQTIYYRVDDYFDNQIYPSSGSYVTLSITSINQFEDIPIDWYSFSVKNMNHSIVKFKMTNGSRTYPQYLYPYEPFYWNVLNGTYTINLTYYNPVTDAIVDYHQENITITDDTYYWIRGYDLQDIIIELTFVNTSVGNLNISITSDITAINSTVNSITTDILSSLTLSESNLTTLINTYSSNYTIIESLISYLNNTIWANFTSVNATINTINNKLTIDFDILNATVDYINNTVWMDFDAVHSNISNVTTNIRTSLTLTESNLTTLNNYIWFAINITDSVVDHINNTIWGNFTNINTNINTQTNTLTVEITNWAAYTSQYNIFPSCILHLPMDEIYGNTVYDYSGNDIDLTYYNASGLKDVNTTIGKFGGGFQFNSTENPGEQFQLSVPDNSPINNSGSCTYSMWVKPNISGYSGVMYLMNLRTNYGAPVLWRGAIISYDSGDEEKFRFGLNDGIGTGPVYAVGSTTHSGDGNTWYHVVGSWDNQTGNMSIYVDGNWEGTNTKFNDTYMTSLALHFPGFDGTPNFHGVIDDARIFNRCLSPDEVLQLYQSSTITSGQSHIETQINSVSLTVNNFETNITNLSTNIWSSINITNSAINYLNSTVNVNILRVNTTINYINDTVWQNFTLINQTINETTLNILLNINLSEANLSSLNLNIWANLNLTDAIISYLNNTMWANFTIINTTIDTINNKLTIDFDMLNVNITYLNNTIWTNLTAINSNIGLINNSIHSTISIAESNLTTLNNNIWNSINLTDSIVTYFNNTIWSNLSLIRTTVDNINNNIWINLSIIESAVGNISTNVSIDYSIINTSIDNLNNSLSVRITLVESNLTSLNNNIWNSINITDSVIDHINNTLWNEIAMVNVTLDYLNNTIWTNLSLIDSDIDTLSVSVHTSLAASETNISNIVYNVWSSLNISNATIDYLNASIWNNLSFIQSSLNNTNLTITNMILLMENNITSLVITIENIIDFALMPDIIIWSRNPPMVFSVYDKEGMAIGGNIIKICPALITIATTRVETTGNWINSTAQIPYNGTVENGTITILEDALYISGSGSISYINITYTDNGTLMQNTTYIPSKINLYGENLTINASGDIHILRETQYHQLYKFYWDYDAITGGHTAGIDIINPMAVPIYDVYVYVEFSNRSTADPTTVVMKDVANDGTVSEHGEDYDISFVGIHFYLLSVNASSTRGFTIEYTKQFDDAYRYGEEIVGIPTYDKTVWNGLSFNTFIIGWINDEDTIFRGAVYAKLNFEIPTEINKDSVRIWDDDNNVELDSSCFIPGSGFIRIGADGIGDVSPGGGRSFQVYFLMTEYPGADPTELHLNTPIWMGITPFLIILLVGLILIGYSTYVYIYKEKKDWKNGIVLGVFIIFIFWVLSYMGV